MTKNGKRVRNFYRGRKYKELQARVFLRDGYRCTECGSIQDLTLDHITPRVQDESLFWDDDNCRTLCNKCRVKNDLVMWSRGELKVR